MNHMYNDDELGRKVTALSFVAMLSVMFIHSSVEVSDAFSSLENALIRFFGDFLTSWAVPFFFVISGYFFYKKRYATWRTLLKRKLDSLMVPYLAWTIIGTIAVFPLIIFSNRIAGRPILDRTVLGTGSIVSGVIDCLGVDGVPKWNVPLGYVRGLLSIFVMAPILVFIIRRMKWVGFCGACFLVFVFPFLKIPYVIYQARGIGYFYFGMLLSEGVWIMRPLSGENCISEWNDHVTFILRQSDGTNRNHIRADSVNNIFLGDL